MQTRHKIEIDSVGPFRGKKKLEPTDVCPKCGGPAEVDTFWRISPQRPGYRVLTRQISCGQRRRRQERASTSNFCPIMVEECRVEPIPEVDHLVPPRIDGSGLPSPPPQAAPAEVVVILDEGGPCKAMSEAENGRVKSTRGRLSVEVREQILTMHSQNIPLEQIAEETSRSLTVVRKVVEGPDSPLAQASPECEVGDLDVDDVIEFLCELPDEAVAEVVQLARLIREKNALRSSLEVRLRDLRRPD